MNKFEEAIAVFAPRYAVKRFQARMALKEIRAYEAAAKGRRTDGWKTSGSSANAETRSGIGITRNRARALVRDNPYAARAVSVIASNMVGYGIKTTIQTPNKKASKPLQDGWNAWAESTQCDVDGLHNLYGLQELAARCIVEAGEVIIRRAWRSPKDGLSVPMQIQVLEPDYIDTNKEGSTTGGNTIIQGIEFDKRGRRVAYWLFDSHPGDTHSFRFGIESKRVLVDDIIHVHRMDRPGQVRGITWLAPVVIRLRDFDEYEDAQLVRQKIAACFTAFVYENEAGESTGASKEPLVDRMEPALIQRLGPGENVTLASPPGVSGYAEYASVTLHAIATGIGVPYEALTGDYSQVNFTSGRMGKADFHAMLDAWQWNMFIPKFCGGVFRWFAQGAELAGLPVRGATAKHTPPRRTLTDPTREIPALIKAVRGGGETLFGMIRAMGYEPEEFLREVSEGNRLLDQLGITLDCDPRRMTNAGQAQIEDDSSSQDEPKDDSKKSKDKLDA